MPSKGLRSAAYGSRRCLIVSLRNVSVRYSRQAAWVLHDVDIELCAGSTVGVVGVNGSGKSTLLRVTAIVLRPTRGLLERPATAGLASADIPEGIRLSPRSYLRAMGRISGVRSPALHRQVDQILERLAVTGDLTAPTAHLSTGNRRKVLLGQAFLGRPNLIVLDEPARGLDLHGLVALKDLIREASGDGAIVVIAEHDRSWLADVCQQWAVLQDRAVNLTSATPADSLPAPVEASVFIGLDSAPDVAQLRGWHGVRAVNDADGDVVLEVELAMRDEVLLRCLHLGCGVTWLGPGT